MVALLIGVVVEVFSARGIVAFLGDNNIVVLSTFTVSLLTALAMATGTDYGIFSFGRYQQARRAGEDPETAYYATFIRLVRNACTYSGTSEVTHSGLPMT